VHAAVLALAVIGVGGGTAMASEPAPWPCGVAMHAPASRALASQVVAAPHALAAGPTALRTLVLLMNFRDAPFEPFTPDDARSRLFLGPDSVDAWYREMSEDALSLTGKVRPDGDVLGWFTVPYDGAGACDFGVWSDAARVAAEAAGADLGGYDREVYVFPGGVTSCGFIGTATVSAPAKVWMNGNLDQAFLAHELSHNFGLLHASGLRCVDFTGRPIPLGEHCEPDEYGDPFDPMGNNQRSLPRHLGNFHKEKVGFLQADEAPDGTTLTVTTDGVYVLTPSEQPLPGSVQTLRIPRPYAPAAPTPFYLYLDFRQPFGTFFDDFAGDDPAVTGVAVRLGPDVATFGQAYLLDMTPENYLFQDATLAEGRSFLDGPNGITVTVLDVSPAAATVAITIAPDTVPPAAPGGLAAVVANDASSIALSWQPVTGDPSVIGYRVFRDGVQIGATAESSFVDTDPRPGTRREYQVVTEDAAGNQSETSARVTVLVQSVAIALEITRPSPGAIVPRRTVRVQGRASSDVAIVSIELVLDGLPAGSRTFKRAKTSRLFSRNVRVAALASGPHTITALATDALGRPGIGTLDVIRP